MDYTESGLTNLLALYYFLEYISTDEILRISNATGEKYVVLLCWDELNLTIFYKHKI